MLCYLCQALRKQGPWSGKMENEISGSAYSPAKTLQMNFDDNWPIESKDTIV